MRNELRVVAYFAIVCGSIALCVGWSDAHQSSVGRAAGPIVVAGLALLGAAAGLSTWQDERKRAREQEQRDVYATLVLQLLSRFTSTGAWDLHLEAQVRAQVAVWAEPKVVEKLSAWNRVYDEHVPATAAGHTVPLGLDARAAFQKATAEVAQAVRKELSPDDKVSVEELTNALFNNPKP